MILSYLLTFFCIFRSTISTSSDGNNLEQLQKSIIPHGVTNFGNSLLKLIHEKSPQTNILISPLNIYSALAITHLGAAGITRTELQKILGIPESKNETEIHQSLGAIIKRIQEKANKFNLFTETSLANGLFIQNGFKIKDAFLQDSRKYYDIEPKNLDFSQHSQEATDFINKWVSKTTKNRIPELFKSPIEPSTAVVLTCALYFSGKWSEPFPEYKTKKDKFTTANNEEKLIDFMNNVKQVPFLEEPSLHYQAIRLPYERNQYEMILVLPTPEQTLNNLTKHLQVEHLQKLFNDRGSEGMTLGVDYKIPKIKFSWSNSIKETLKQKGVKSLFHAADLTNMVAEGNLKVSDIIHATEIEVDEKGTKASAVTGIKFVPYMAPVTPHNPKKFVLNRPFLMMIFNRPSQTVLFYAYVNNPNTV